MNTTTRHYDIDWLRVLGTLGVFLFHNARFFNDEDWHVKNLELSFGATVFVNIFNQFIMPLFFCAFGIRNLLCHSKTHKRTIFIRTR